MYRTVYEWAMKNQCATYADRLGTFFEECGDSIHTQDGEATTWAAADRWQIAHGGHDLEFSDCAERFSRWLAEATAPWIM